MWAGRQVFDERSSSVADVLNRPGSSGSSDECGLSRLLACSSRLRRSIALRGLRGRAACDVGRVDMVDGQRGAWHCNSDLGWLALVQRLQNHDYRRQRTVSGSVLYASQGVSRFSAKISPQVQERDDHAPGLAA